MWSVSLRAAVSFGPAYIHTSPGPPWQRLPISMNTMFPRQPVLLILSLSQVTMGVEGSAKLMMSSCPGWLSLPRLLKAMTWRPKALTLDPTSSGRMYTAHTESVRGKKRRGGDGVEYRSNNKFLMNYYKGLSCDLLLFKQQKALNKLLMKRGSTCCVYGVSLYSYRRFIIIGLALYYI